MRVESRYSKIVKLLSKDPFPLSPNLYLWNFTWRVAAGSGTPTAVQKQVYTYHKGSGRMRAEMKSESGPGRRRWDSRAAVVRPPHPNGEGHPHSSRAGLSTLCCSSEILHPQGLGLSQAGRSPWSSKAKEPLKNP